MSEEQELVSTDEAILNSIGEGDESTTDDGTGEENTGTEENASEETSNANNQQGTGESGSEQQQGNAGGPQDLKDAQGNIIATGGKERRFYETAQREKTRADAASRELEVVKAQMEAINNAGTLGTQYDLTPEELTSGAQIMASYKTQPVETIQYLLTQAQAMGHNTDAISGGGVDMKAIQQMLSTQLQPLMETHQQTQETEQVNAQALEIYNEFHAKYPDAMPHEDTLSRLLQDDPTLSPEAAYYKLQSYYAKNRLDWTKPLATLQQEQQQARVNTPRPQPIDGNVTPINVRDTTEVADVNTSTDDIIRQAMAEAGIT